MYVRCYFCSQSKPITLFHIKKKKSSVHKIWESRQASTYWWCLEARIPEVLILLEQDTCRGMLRLLPLENEARCEDLSQSPQSTKKACLIHSKYVHRSASGSCLHLDWAGDRIERIHQTSWACKPAESYLSECINEQTALTSACSLSGNNREAKVRALGAR